MTAAPTITETSGSPAAGDAAARAPLRSLPQDLGSLFASLLNGATAPQDSARDAIKPGGRSIDVDRALLEQLHSITAQETDAPAASQKGAPAGLKPTPTTEKTQPVAAALASLAVPATPVISPSLGPAAKQQPTVPSEPVLSAEIARAVPWQAPQATAAPDVPKGPQAKAVPDAKKDAPKAQNIDIAEQLKALAGATDEARHQATPVQTTVDKALPPNLAASNADGQQQQQTGHGDRGQQHNAQKPASDAARPNAVAEQIQQQPAMSATAPRQPATTTADSAPLVPSVQTAAAHALPVSLQLTHRPEAVDLPNLGALAVSIVAKARDGEKHFDIRLDPPELGRIEVKLTIDDSGKAQASLTAEKPHALELLQRDRAVLERALRDAGLDLAGGGLNFSLRGQDRDANPLPRGGRALAASAILNSEAGPAIAGLPHILPVPGRLDIRV